MFSKIFKLVDGLLFATDQGVGVVRPKGATKLPPLTAAEKEARSTMIFDAFDVALQSIARIPPLSGRKLTLDDARAAVKAAHFACGPTARAAEARLQAQGVRNIKFHSLKGHYVLLDEITGLLHDSESPEGVDSPQQLPIWARTQALAPLDNSVPLESSEIFEQYAALWLAKFPVSWNAGSQTISCENKKGGRSR